MFEAEKLKKKEKFSSSLPLSFLGISILGIKFYPIWVVHKRRYRASTSTKN
jgi:hypothetical protein